MNGEKKTRCFSQKHLIDLNILNAIIYSNQGFLYKQYSYKKRG